MNIDMPRSAVQILKGGDEAEIFAALPHLLQGHGVPKGIQDEPAHLSLIRLVREVDEPARRATNRATLQWLRFVTRDFSAVGPAVFEELVRFCAKLENSAINDEMAGFARTFKADHQLSAHQRQAVLGILVDAKPPQSEAFWMDIYHADEINHAGMAASGLLSAGALDKAVALYPSIIKGTMTASIVASLIDLKWDELAEEGRRRLTDLVAGIISRCEPQFVGPLQAWLSEKTDKTASSAAS